MRQRLAKLTTSERSSRRQVTVLFADVAGYTSLVEKLDPEYAGSLVDRLWGNLGRIIVDDDGRVVQHLDDGVMALWGGESTPASSISDMLAWRRSSGPPATP